VEANEYACVTVAICCDADKKESDYDDVLVNVNG
jgi:hypothetical protein